MAQGIHDENVGSRRLKLLNKSLEAVEEKVNRHGRVIVECLRAKHRKGVLSPQGQ